MNTANQQTTLKAVIRMMASNHEWGIDLRTEAELADAEAKGLAALQEGSSFASAFDDARKRALHLMRCKATIVPFDRRKH